jgi:hypothetical protein
VTQQLSSIKRTENLPRPDLFGRVADAGVVRLQFDEEDPNVSFKAEFGALRPVMPSQ